MDWTSDGEGSEAFDWDSNDDGPEAESSAPPPPSTIADPSDKVAEAGPSRPPVVSHFVDMGFEEDMVVKAIDANGGGDMEAILEMLLAYAAVEKASPECKYSPGDLSSRNDSDEVADDDKEDDCLTNWSDHEDEAVEKASPEHELSPGDCSFRSDSDEVDKEDDCLTNWSDYEDEEFREDLSAEDKRLLILVDMGFSTNEASAAIDRCGSEATVLELADSIHAAQLAEEFGGSLSRCTNLPTFGHCSSRGRKRKVMEDSSIRRRRTMTDNKSWAITLPNPMVGFGLPYERTRLIQRKLTESAIGPPYFYYENVALAPKGVWETMSRFLYDIEPEFVDSKYFSASARKRGYIHNLPIDCRFLLRPIPPKTIQEALPSTKKCWPSWDPRKQFNCLQTCIASAKLTDRIRKELSMYDGEPPLRTQQYVLNECRKWNLVWVGRNKVAPLEPDEMEILLGFPKDHTRGGGISRTDRYRSLGNSFQVDTVAYHLSVLKDIFPNGMTVLSLFSGIGGAEVALHRLGIHLKAVVSVEIAEENRNILRSWWEQTNQTGILIELADVKELNPDKLGQLISTLGGFDLIIGGSPCNNLTGSNRHTRDGLEGVHSALFYDYFRILDLVKGIMAKK